MPIDAPSARKYFLGMESILTLREVEEAIQRCMLTGQAYTRVGITKTNVSLESLMKMRRQLISEANRSATGTGGCFSVDFS